MKQYSEKKILEIAEKCHETNRVFCQSIGEKQPSWQDAPQNIKDSAIDGVKVLLDNPKMTPKDTHDNWLKFKENDGWVYGEKKDADKKTHPCMVPYEDLPQDQKIKDWIIKCIVEKNR